jgi:hypothetical protein
MSVPTTWIPAPRSPSLGSNSLSIIVRICKPFFRSERARARPEGPAPTSKDHQLDRVSPILLQSLQCVPAACVVLCQGAGCQRTE